MSTELCKSDRGLFFGVSTDVLPANLAAFIFLIANVVFVVVVQALFSWLRKNNFFKKLFEGEKWGLIYGQVTNVLMPLTLPWSFVMLEAGVRNFETKVNCAAYILFYFVGLVFPIYYLFDLLSEKEEELIAEKRK